jgi:glutamyl-tRNA reductase
MRISVTGINHHTTPVSLRERYAFAADELAPALARLAPDFEAASILSTCNRTELYLATEAAIDSEAAVAALSRAREAASPEGVVFYHHTGIDAVRHLYGVAAGIDSLVIGESEILGQVREAFPPRPRPARPTPSSRASFTPPSEPPVAPAARPKSAPTVSPSAPWP